MSLIFERFIPNFFEITDETKVRNNLLECGSECSLKFNFQENSTSFKSCYLFKQAAFHLVGLCINITNEYLSDSENSTIRAVNFANEDYWFSDILITPPGVLFDREITAPEDPLYDPSACSLVIICANKARNKILTISRYITKQQTSSRNLASDELKNLINNLHRNVGTNSDRTRDRIIDGTHQGMCDLDDFNIREQLSTININNFIPTEEKFIYNISPNKVNNNNVSQYSLLFPRSDPIIIPNDSIVKLNEIFHPKAAIFLRNRLGFSRTMNRIQISQDTPKTFISSSKAINNLYEDSNIFIRCQPTDNEGNILVSGQPIRVPEEEFNLDVDKLMGDNNNIFIGAFIGIIIMIVIMKGGEYVLKAAPKIVLGDK